MSNKRPIQNFGIDPLYAQNMAADDSNAWSEGFDDFSRISRHSAQASEDRLISSIFTQEQLMLFDNGQLSELHFQLQQEISVKTGSAKAYLAFALCLMACDNTGKAAEMFAQALEYDESLYPGKYLGEIKSDDPQKWLDMAEELGHFGFIEACEDICDRISQQSKFSGKARASAVQSKKRIQQQYFAARDRIISGNAPKTGDGSYEKTRFMSVLLFVIGPIICFILLSSFVYSSYQFSSGQNALGTVIYRMELLKKHNHHVDDNITLETLLDKSAQCFINAKRYNPFDTEAVFMLNKTRALTLELGQLRKEEDFNKWEGYQWKEARRELAASKRALEDLNLSDAKNLKLQKKWQDFYTTSQKTETNFIY